MVDAAGIGGRGRRAAQGEVPLEEVGFERCSVEVGGGIDGYLGGFFYCGVV